MFGPEISKWIAVIELAVKFLARQVAIACPIIIFTVAVAIYDGKKIIDDGLRGSGGAVFKLGASIYQTLRANAIVLFPANLNFKEVAGARLRRIEQLKGSIACGGAAEIGPMIPVTGRGEDPIA